MNGGNKKFGDEGAMNSSEKSGPIQEGAANVNFFSVDLGLRLLALASTITSVIVMVTGKETKTIQMPLLLIPLTVVAKFNYSPAFVYLVVANSLASLYNIFVLSILAPSVKKKACVHTLFRLVVLDTLMAGIVASATGASTAVAYVGLKGNSHVQWNKICNVFNGFCHHVGASSFLSLLASICFVLLIMTSAYSIYRRSR
ncbi:CASP-like protein 1D1 [Nymphaea colorata]|nr:CASP-like protein 1D1 [Nymphaea colorata]